MENKSVLSNKAQSGSVEHGTKHGLAPGMAACSHNQVGAGAASGVRLLRWLPVLLPLAVLFGYGLRGLDFGLHWDERPWQIGPVKHMVQAASPLPAYYNYPSFDYWLNLLVLAPDAVASRVAGNDLRTHLLQTLDSHSYLLRLRCVYLFVTSLTLVWVYFLVLCRRDSWIEALLAASLLGFSWEVAYHLRWVATDGMLMQFATLAVLLASYALETRREFWLIAAAIVAALAFGTKYPGGLVLLPVGMAAWFMSAGCSLRETTVRLARISAVFVATFVITTPAILVHPRQVLTAVLYETQHYATGHGGHTVPRGFQHGWRMLEYFGTVLFSSNVAVALFIFVLAIVGISSLMIHNWRAAAVLLAFPIAHVLYFSTQQAMVVRNLLAVAPFLAIAAAVGAGAIKSFLRQRAQTTAAFPGEKFVEVLWVGLLAAVLCWNALWLVGSANSIIARHSDRFIREAAQYVRIHSSTKFLLSPRVKRDIAIVQPGLDNITADLNQADAFVLYAREGMHRWHDWPANRPNLTQACFGPREINFNMYPGWWGDDRILVISHHRADEIGLHIAGISNDTAPAAETTQPRPPAEAPSASLMSANSLPGSWASNGMATLCFAPDRSAHSHVAH